MHRLVEFACAPRTTVPKGRAIVALLALCLLASGCRLEPLQDVLARASVAGAEDPAADDRTSSEDGAQEPLPGDPGPATGSASDDDLGTDEPTTRPQSQDDAAAAEGDAQPNPDDDAAAEESVAQPAGSGTADEQGTADGEVNGTADDAAQPTAPSTDGTSPDPAPESSPEGFPDASSTGVPPGTSLTSSGSMTVSRDGAVIDALDVSGRIRVSADNVTIRRTRVTTNGALYAIRVDPDTRGTVVEDVELIGTDNNASVGIVYGNYTIRRAEIRGFEDGPRLGSNTVVEDCWVHSTRKFEGTHNDAAQSLGGSNIKLLGNRLEGPWRASTSAALLSANWSPLRNVVVRGNLLSGGGYTLYVERKDGAGQPAPSNILVEDNVWVEDSWAFGPVTTAAEADITWRNNRTTTGALVSR